MPEEKRSEDPLEGAQYGPKEPRSRAQRLMDTLSDVDLYAAAQSLGPTGYGVGGMTSVAGKASKAAKPASKAKYAKGGKVGAASKRADGIAQRGKTKGRMV